MVSTEHTAERPLRETFEQLGFVTSSHDVLALLRRAYKAAQVSDVTILLEGETGTGKQVLAQSIHRLDQKRRSHPFVTVHCSTISEALAESELFGHQRGAFSGAVGERKGLFQAADHGTLLLDDTNDLPSSLQPKLLDVIQRRAVRPVGSDREIAVDVRVIAACNQPLEPLVQSGRFRGDLYHRLNVVKISLPPLRQRKSDFERLILAMAKRHAALYCPIHGVEPQLLRFLEALPFPGNVRELENSVQRMLFLKSEGSFLEMADWWAQAEQETDPGDLDWVSEAAGAIWKAISESGIAYGEALDAIEKRVLEMALNIPGPTRREIAQRLRTSERTLYHKMRTHGLSSVAR
jgi:transcriptional regulator with PAS, ATPase and Fis domain